MSKAPQVTWASDWSEHTARAAGAGAMALLFNTRRWVNRRTEHIEFLDENQIRRRVSVDFTLPYMPERLLIAGGSAQEPTTFVPLTLLRKRVLRGFDLRDEDGRALPLLTSRQNSQVTQAMLFELATVLLEGADLDPDVAADLSCIASRSPEEAELALARLMDPAAPADSQRARLMAEPRMESLCEDLVHSFLFLVEVPADHHRRRIIKFSYEEAPGERLAQRASSRWRAAAQTLGLAPVPFLLPAASVGDSSSYHLEVQVPDELEVTRTRLVDLKRAEVLSQTSYEQGTQRAHVYTPAMDRTVWGLVECSVTAARRGLVSGSLVCTLLTALLLTLGLTHLSTLAQASDAAGALLLAIPAVFAGYLLRPEEHPLVTKLFAGLRLLVGASALAAITAAALLVAGIDRGNLHAIWELLTYLSWGCTAVLAVAVCRPDPQRLLERLRRRRGRRALAASPQGLPPAEVSDAVADTKLELDGFPVESAEGWRSGFEGIDSSEGIARTLELAATMREIPSQRRFG